MNDKVTIGEKYGPAIDISDPHEAELYFEQLVEHTMRVHGKSRLDAEVIERANLGYWAGYYSHEVRDRVEKLFKCEHPIFGSIARNGPPSPEQALKVAIAVGKKMDELKQQRS